MARMARIVRIARIAYYSLVFVTVLSLLGGCQSMPPPPVEQTPAYTPDTFVPVPNYQYMPTPTSGPEREVLARLEQELTYNLRLAREAQAQANPAVKTRFDYNALAGDIDRIRQGVREHLHSPGTEPRVFVPLRGQYAGAGN